MAKYSLKATTIRAKSKHARLRVGDTVRVRVGGKPIQARVVEDRGRLGVKGRRLVRVQLIRKRESDESNLSFEVPAEELIRSSGTASPHRSRY